MAERLADSRFRFTIPVFHVPPFFSGAVHPEDQRPVRQLWHPSFVSAHVPLAFSGHSHHYERLEADGITYIVSGGGSGILYAPGETLPESQVFARRTHFVLMEIYADRIELSAIDKDGEVFDRASIPLQ
jgi:acid phosphatase